MSETLIVAEKPSVAATIAAALGAKEKKDGYIAGNGCLVSWCVGHLVQLAEAAAYGEQYKKWSYDSLPILPQEWQYAVASDKGKQFKILKDLMHRADVSEVVNACDAGARENSFSALSMMWRAVKSPCAVFGFPLWKKAQSRRALRPSKTGKSTTPFIPLPFAGQKPIGLSVSI